MVFHQKKKDLGNQKRDVQLFSSGQFLSLPCMRQTAHIDLDVNEIFIKDVTKVLWEGRQAGAKTFYIAGDLNVELGLLCTGDDDVQELNELYGPLCWQECENDQGGF